MSDKPTIVCLCGSTRFSQEYREAMEDQTLLGKIVLSIGINLRDWDHPPVTGETIEETKARLDELHLRKIDLADEVYILNRGRYIGESTQRELEYALDLGKEILFLEFPLGFKETDE